MTVANIDELLKQYKGIISRGDEKRPKTYFPIGPLSVNLAIGNPNGVPSGRFIQIFGKPSVGKSTLVLDTIQQWQHRNDDNVAMYVDFERAYDKDYAASIGVDVSRLLVVRADTTEQGMDAVEDAITNYGFKLVVVDSIAMGMPSVKMEKKFGDPVKIASAATLWTEFLTKMIGKIDNNDTLIILVNQMRKNFNTMSREEEIPWGGNALQFASTVNIALSRLKTEDSRITTQVLVKKNKVGNPQTRAEFFIDYGKGIRHDIDVITLAINAGIVKRSGAWYTYRDYKGQGLEGAAVNFPLDEIRSELLTRENV